MSIMKIEVFPDTSQPAGGHAIIRLKGIALLPPGTTFRIDPIDDSLDEGDFEGWPRGNLSPLDTRQTPEGIELRIGPDVVDAPLLEPGTPVTISVPDSKLSAELIWPDLPLSSTVTPAAVVMSPSQMAAELAATDRAKTEAANAAKVAKEAELAAAARAENERAEAASAEKARVESERIEAARIETARAEAERLAKLAAASALPDNTTQQQRMAAAARQLEAALALEPDEPTTVGTLAKALDAMPASSKTASEALSNLAATASGTDRPRQANTATLSSLSKPATDRPTDRLDATATALPERDHSLPTIILKRADAPGNPPSTIETTKLRRETIDGRLATQSSPSRLLPFLAGAGAAGLALAALLAVSSFRPGPAAPISGAQMAASQKPVLADAFSVGTQSPRGEIAVDVDLPTALRLADYNLHGVDRPIDRAEAEFWLKKAMSLTASHSQIRWAMTQLGTLSAEPVTGSPDYEKARLLWEISAANGDPVAMCFLGTLLENGLGLGADRARALEQFKRARSAGGCPNSDEAIARLSK
ncbi:MAG: tetratricopeptide repeat protein [Hyphomicrobiaceae bacterium]